MSFLKNILNTLRKKKILINIGENGILISAHRYIRNLDELFVEELSEDNFNKVKNFFNRNSNANIYVLLDTVAQNYNLKSFPAVGYFDILQMVKRAIKKEKPAKSLARYFYLDRESVSKKWNYMFVFIALESPLTEWLDFFNTLPNRVMGIYAIPVELQGFIKILRLNKKKSKETNNNARENGVNNLLSTKKKKSKKVKKDDWQILILQTKISGLREIAFKNGKLIFTRLLNNNSKNPSFILKFKDDLMKTIEYLKRLDPNIDLATLSIYTVLDKKAKDSLDNLYNLNLNLTNYTPKDAKEKLGLNTSLKENEFCDNLIKATFLKKPTKLKFLSIKMKLLNRFFMLRKILKYSITISIIAVLFLFSFIIIEKISLDKKLDNITKNINTRNTVLSHKKRQEFGLKEQNILEIEEVGSLYETITYGVGRPYPFLEKIIDLKTNHNILAERIEWRLVNYNFSTKNTKTRNFFIFDGEMNNPDGNVEILFKNFDSTLADLKKMFPGYIVNNSKLPSDIDFNRAYYNVDFDFRLEGPISDINPYEIIRDSSESERDTEEKEINTNKDTNKN